MGIDRQTFVRHGLDRQFNDGDIHAAINGRRNVEIVDMLDSPGDRQYHPCPEARPTPETPRGAVQRYRDWAASTVFPETRRDIWVYTPPDGLPGEPPRLAVFNDGAGYLDREGPVRAAAVLDSMRAAGEIEPTVGVFVNPGIPAHIDPADLDEQGRNLDTNRQRSIEYDTIDDRYASFLEVDVLPFVEAELGTALSRNPDERTIVGISSGGICAFNAAWHRPDLFGRVVSHCGSFVGIRGGHNYPYLVRTTPRKPLRVFLQSGAGDAQIVFGNWALANQAMADSLAFAGYDHRFEFGAGAHSLRHGGALFAETLRWLWRD